ncbi:MAG: hypothetical protein EOO43_05360 [Flavobacterium sp.]|nr:MAG: hypothetical protein EOO43_05360 [Flavobacterium sp.]
MSDVIGDDRVDVTELIKSGYKPIYCQGKIEKLYYSKSQKTIKDSNMFWKTFKAWKIENKRLQNLSERDILKNTRYKYTYMVGFQPMDVFQTQFRENDSSHIIFIRQKDDELVLPFQSHSWVVSNCDN